MNLEKYFDKVKMKYWKWILNQIEIESSYLSGEIIETILEFDKYIELVKCKDIYQYKNINDVKDALKNIYKIRAQKRYRRYNAFINKNPTSINLLYKDDQYLVFHVKQFEAAKFFSKGTKWCISSIEDWNIYNKINSKIYFIFDLYANSKNAFYKIAIDIESNHNNTKYFINYLDAKDVEIHELEFDNEIDYKFEYGTSLPNEFKHIKNIINNYILPYHLKQDINVSYGELINKQLEYINDIIQSTICLVNFSSYLSVDYQNEDCFIVSISGHFHFGDIKKEFNNLNEIYKLLKFCDINDCVVGINNKEISLQKYKGFDIHDKSYEEIGKFINVEKEKFQQFIEVLTKEAPLTKQE